MTDKEKFDLLYRAGLECQNLETYTEVGQALILFKDKHAEWSRKTFGPDGDPTGALRHLKKEVDEILADPKDVIEYADAFIILLDVIRRAGYTFEFILAVAIEKQKINEKREWSKPIPGEPCEHVREKDG
jgi:hypothetical protein